MSFDYYRFLVSLIWADKEDSLAERIHSRMKGRGRPRTGEAEERRVVKK